MAPGQPLPLPFKHPMLSKWKLHSSKLTRVQTALIGVQNRLSGAFGAEKYTWEDRSRLLRGGGAQVVLATRLCLPPGRTLRGLEESVDRAAGSGCVFGLAVPQMSFICFVCLI